MNILVIGSGGREHALVWKLSQEAEVHALPGNPGMDCETHDVPISDHEGIIKVCLDIQPDLVVIGPENPLIDGLGDLLRAKGLVVFGPNATGAQLEASKAFSKALMSSSGVPTARHWVCTSATDAVRACKDLFAEGSQVAVKASGNALGKGVALCENEEETEEAIDIMMVNRVFGSAGDTVVIEERLIGREFSLLTIASESGFHSLPIAQDYKRIYEGDSGPNTGGMGSYSPVDWVDKGTIEEVEASIVTPALSYLRAQNIRYRGVLFSGVMMTETGPKCLEYNVRFGDPETQTVLMRLGAGFAAAIRSAALGDPVPPIPVLETAALTVVLANAGYPGLVAGAPEIHLPKSFGEGVKIFHAGTKRVGETLLATGGRVLNVTATGKDLPEARERAFATVREIKFEGMQYRSDIGAT